MDSSGTQRKRALSLSGLTSVGTKLNVGLGPDADHPHLPRIRHPSFALTGDRPSVLDGLIDTASYKIRSTTDKDSTSNNRDHLSSDTSKIKESLSAQMVAALDESGFDTDSRKDSLVTVIAGDTEHPSLSGVESDELIDTQYNNLDLHTLDFSKISNGDCLSSNVLKYYFSKLPGNSKENCGKAAKSPLIPTKSYTPEPHHDVYLPEFLQIHAPAVASMTMPVNQITRAYSRFYHNSSRLAQNVPAVVVHPLYERNALTDANYSSGLSDTESRYFPEGHEKSNCGYQSDHHMLEAASEARKLQMTGRRLEQDFHRSTVSLSSSPRAQSGSSTPVTKRRMSISARNSKFNLSQIYVGLLSAKTPGSPSPSSDWSVSNASLDATLAHRLVHHDTRSNCITPPASPIPTEVFKPIRSTSTEHCDANSSTLDRLRSMFTNFKHNLQEDEDNKYFYMDEQSLERRAQAQASNVIAPVSF